MNRYTFMAGENDDVMEQIANVRDINFVDGLTETDIYLTRVNVEMMR